MIPQPQQPLPPETNLLNMKKLKFLVERPNRNLVAGGELSSKCSKVPLLGLTLELVSKELNHFGVIAGLFRQIGGHSSRFVLFCSF